VGGVGGRRQIPGRTGCVGRIRVRRVVFHNAGQGVAWALALVLCGTALAAPPAFKLEATPRQLLAGRDDAATLVLRGAPEQLRDARIACTGGGLRGVRRTDQQVRAEFIPHRSGSATWVLCGAVGGGAGSLLALELQRRDVLAIGTLPALSRVVVKMGSALYGPVRANGDGYVEVPVVLTPSVVQAEIQATPPGKPTEQRPHPLPVTAVNQVLLLSQETEVVADGQRGLAVWAFTLGSDGQPEDLPVGFGSSEGTFIMKRAGTGMWSGVFTPTARVSPGEATLTARLPNNRPVVLKVDLKKGLRPRLVLEAPPRELLADGFSSVEVKVQVADQLGKALAGLLPRLTAERGQVGPVQERQPGIYVAQYTVPSGSAGPVRLTAEVSGAEPASLALHLLAPPRLTLDVAPRQLIADGRSRAVISVIARDPDGRELADGTPLAISTSLGEVPETVKTLGGRAEVELVAGKAAGLATIVVSALDVSATASVQLLPGAPKELTFIPERSQVLCNGTDGTDLRLFIRDANGNGLDGVPIQVELSGPSNRRVGRLERVAALGKGEFIARYYAPADCAPGALALEAVAGELRSTREIQLSRAFPRVMGLTAWAGAQSDMRSLVWGQLGVETAAGLGLLADKLLASGGLNFAYTGFDVPGSSQSGFTGSVRVLAANVWLGPRYTLFERDGFSGYVGAGLDGYASQINEQLVLGSETTRDSFWLSAFGAHVRAGTAIAMGSGALVVQLRYGWADLRAPKLGIYYLPLAGISAQVGYQVQF